MDRRMWRRAVLAVAAAALTALTVSCGLVPGIYAVELPADRLEGLWVSPGGGTTLTFRADHSFTAEHFEALSVSTDCESPTGPVSGRWAFLAPIEPGSSLRTADEATARGQELSLAFADHRCDTSAFLFGDEDAPAMCPSRDPDSGCDSTGYLYRSDREE